MIHDENLCEEFRELGEIRSTKLSDHKKKQPGDLEKHVTIMVCISCSSNPSVPTMINGTLRNATTQIEALLNMCCYQVFRWLGGVSLLLFSSRLR